MTKYVYAYKNASEGSKALAEALGIKRIKHNGSKVRGGPGQVIFNWGAGRIPEELMVAGTTIYNRPERVIRTSNKLHSFNDLAGACRMPEYTTQLADAKRWLEQGHMVFARTNLNGSGGDGIVIMYPDHPDTHDVRANLYTKYVKKQQEFRIHIVRNQVIDRQRKGLKEEFRGREDNNFFVRNLANGFVYVRNDIQVPEDVEAQALLAMTASRLDYGAVDVIYNASQRQAYVLEINTAPGLQGTTVTNWANALNRL